MLCRTRAICLCTPSLGTVSMWWARQVAEIIWPMNMGRRLCFEQDSKGGEIAESRNSLVRKCLSFESERCEIDSIFWLDDDVLPTRGALLQLYNHHSPIASGVYFTKGEPSQPLIFPGRVQGTAKFVPDQVIKAWGHGMGLCLVKMDVYRQLLQKGLPKDKYGNPEWYKTTREFKMEGDMLDCGGTEDLYFLDMVSKIGITPVVDCGKWAFGFHFDAAKSEGFPKKQFAQWSSAKAVEWDTDAGTVKWD